MQVISHTAGRTLLQCLAFVARSSRLVFVTIELLCRISIGSDARLELDNFDIYLAGHHMVPFVMSSATVQALTLAQPQVQTVLSEKPEVADFSKRADILGTSREQLGSEWKILRRFQGELSTQDALITLTTSPEKCAMFPVFSAAIYRLLLLPVGTANVERSFSTLNRILSSERCRLVPGHTCQLMQLAVEGLVCQMSVTLRWRSWRSLVPSSRRLTDYGWPSHVGDCRPLVWNWLRSERTCVNITPFVFFTGDRGSRG